MTLDTNIYVHDEIEIDVIFAKCRDLVGADDSTAVEDREAFNADGSRILWNCPGQGLPAWLMIYYRPGAAIRPDADACDANCWSPDPGEEGEAEHFHQCAHFLRVSFDTAYGYKDELGRGCGDLHACYVAALGQWLDERGVAWSWENEFNGEVHGGEDRYERLTDLMQAGHRATHWFAAAVLPAIASHLPGDSA